MRNSADYTEDMTLIEAGHPFDSRELKDSDGPAFQFISNATVIEAGGTHEVDTKTADIRASFFQNYKYWNDETQILSVNNLNNSYYKSIVEMGTEALPMIAEMLKKGDDQVVYALDEIFPGAVKYEGYVSLHDACDTWRSILKQIGIK